MIKRTSRMSDCTAVRCNPSTTARDIADRRLSSDAEGTYLDPEATPSRLGTLTKVSPRTAKSHQTVVPVMDGPLIWQYLSGTTPVNTSALVPVVCVRSLTSCSNGTETGPTFIDKQGPGNNDFNYDLTTFTWHFNWQTKPFAVGRYNIYVDLTDTLGNLLQTNGPAKVRLK
jgi:hypothetical protein